MAVVTVLVAVLGMLSQAGVQVASANPSIAGSSTGPDGKIWMPNYGDGSVMAFDPETLDVVMTIPDVGDHPLVIKMLPDQSKMFVGNFGPLTWQVSVIDMATQSVVKQIPTLGPAYAVASLSNDSRFLYVPTALSVVQVIDTQSLDVVRTLPIALPPAPAHVELSPDGAAIYVLSAMGTATKYDALTGVVLAPPIFLNGFAPGWGAISVDGSTLYAVNFFAGLTMVDTKSWAVTNTVQLPIDSGPISATLTPDGTKLWVCNYMSNEIVILDAQTTDVIKRIATDKTPVYVGFTDDGATAYVSFVDDASGIAQAMNSPAASFVSKTNAYWAGPMDLSTTLTTYDVETGSPRNSTTVKGVLVTGVYPK